MTIGIDHLIHANVVCDDFDRSLDFYTRLLGARVIGQVFEFDAGADFRAILGVTGPAWIAEHGVPVVGGPVTLTPMPGVRRHVVTIRDPDGTLLTLMEFPELRR
jgi:hypothetical protein